MHKCSKPQVSAHDKIVCMHLDRENENVRGQHQCVHVSTECCSKAGRGWFEEMGISVCITASTECL